MKGVEFGEPQFAAAMEARDGSRGVSEKEILAQFSKKEQKEIKYKQRVLASLAYFIGKDFEIPVELNQPGGGWNWNFKDNKIGIDPKDLLEKPLDYLRYLICHEGSHRRISRTDFIPMETWQQPGFSYMMNAIEDPRVDNFVAENYPKFKEFSQTFHDVEIENLENTFGIKVRAEDVPNIPFSKEDLEKAKELGQFLILRVDKAKDGTGLSMKKMHDLLAEEFKKDGHGKILVSINWYKEEEFFTKETPKLSWALTSKEVIPDSTSKNYLQQTESIIDYIKEKVFKGGALPKEYQDAIREFAEQKGKISKLMKDDWQEATKILEELRITKLTRKSPSESVYDFLAYFKTNKERLLENMYTWTSCRASDGRLVHVGRFDAGGASVPRGTPGNSGGDLGVAFSRSL